MRAVLLNAISDTRITTLVIANKWGGYEKLSEGLTEFKQLIQKRSDLKVYSMLDVPWDQGSTEDEQGTFDPLKHMKRMSEPVKELWVPLPKQLMWVKGNKVVRDVLGAQTELIIPYPYVCHEQQCDLRWYKDDDHLKPRLVEVKGVWLNKIFF